MSEEYFNIDTGDSVNCWCCGDPGWRGKPVKAGGEWVLPEHTGDRSSIICPNSGGPVNSGETYRGESLRPVYEAALREEMEQAGRQLANKKALTEGAPRTRDELQFWDRCVIAVLGSPRANTASTLSMIDTANQLVLERRTVLGRGKRSGPKRKAKT